MMTQPWSCRQSWHLEVARVLCGAGAGKVKAVQDDDTALTMSSRSGHLKVARPFCGDGADKDEALQDDDTALILSSVRAPGGGPSALLS